MSKNLILQIAQMLGVKLGEEFKVETRGGNEYICNFTMAGLFEHDNKESGSYNKELLADIICGNAEIVKLPWKPTMYEEYWTFGKLGKQWIVGTLIWKELPYEILLLGKGWVYRTRAEAETALPAVAKEMGVEFIV